MHIYIFIHILYYLGFKDTPQHVLSIMADTRINEIVFDCNLI